MRVVLACELPPSWMSQYHCVDLLSVTVLVAAGDTVGVAFDQSDEKVLRIYHNGQYLSDQDVRGMRGETWPIIIVAGGATLEVRCLPLSMSVPA